MVNHKSILKNRQTGISINTLYNESICVRECLCEMMSSNVTELRPNSAKVSVSTKPIFPKLHYIIYIYLLINYSKIYSCDSLIKMWANLHSKIYNMGLN